MQKRKWTTQERQTFIAIWTGLYIAGMVLLISGIAQVFPLWWQGPVLLVVMGFAFASIGLWELLKLRKL